MQTAAVKISTHHLDEAEQAFVGKSSLKQWLEIKEAQETDQELFEA